MLMLVAWNIEWGSKQEDFVNHKNLDDLEKSLSTASKADAVKKWGKQFLT